MEEIRPYFGKNVTNCLKGIALIMMFVSHFFMFPSWWVEREIYSLEIAAQWKKWLGQPLGMCVPIFCFITGYFYFFVNGKTYRYSLRKAFQLLIPYWGMMIVLMSISIIIVDYHYTLKDFICESFALHRPTMVFCWYVVFYIAFMLCLPLAIKPMSKDVHADIILTFLAYPMVALCLNAISKGWNYGIFSYLHTWFPVVLMGYIFANYDIFKKIEYMHNRLVKAKCLNIVVCFLLIAIVFLCRNSEFKIVFVLTKQYSVHVCMEAIYTPIFVYAIIRLHCLIGYQWLKKILMQLGKYSMLMWFISCIFYGNCKTFFQPILYYPHYPILVTIWGLLMCYTAARIFNVVFKNITAKVNNFLA